MKKALSTLTLLGVTVLSHSTYAKSEQATIKSLQQQIAALQAQINHLPTQNAHAPFSNFVQTDGKNSSVKFEEISSSNVPYNILKLKKLYGPRAMVLGGFLEMETQRWWGDSFHSTATTNVGGITGAGDDYNYSSGSGISLSAANLDVMSDLNQWAQAYVQLTATGSSAMQVESGFINIGDLDSSPYFLTLGKNRMRFGNFPGAPWAASLSQGIVRPGHINTATIGYAKNNLNLNLAIYNTQASSQALMASAFYNNTLDNGIGYEVNTGLVSNVRGLGNAIGNTLTQSTPGFNIEGNLSFMKFGTSGGFFTTLQNTATTNNKKAGVWYTQVSYTPNIDGQDVSFAVNYSSSYNTQNIPMPLAGDVEKGPSLYGVKSTILMYANTVINDAIDIGLEYALMKTYNSQHTNEITLYTAYYF